MNIVQIYYIIFTIYIHFTKLSKYTPDLISFRIANSVKSFIVKYDVSLKTNTCSKDVQRQYNGIRMVTHVRGVYISTVGYVKGESSKTTSLSHL